MQQTITISNTMLIVQQVAGVCCLYYLFKVIFLSNNCFFFVSYSQQKYLTMPNGKLPAT